MQQKMITQKRTQAECRPRYQEVAVDHTAVSDMKYKQMNRAVLTEFLSYSSLKRSKGNTHLFHFLRLWARAATRPGYKDGIAYNTGMLILPLDSKKHRNHLCRVLDVRTPEDALHILKEMQKMKVLTYKVQQGQVWIWLDWSCIFINPKKELSPMQRLFYAESGFILFPITAISKLLRLDEPDRHLSPMDMFLDLWFHGTVCDPYTAGSVLMPVVHLELNQKVYKECMENEKILDPRVHLDDLAVRWNCSKSTVSRRLGTFVSDGLLGIYETHPACLESQGMLLVLPGYCSRHFSRRGNVVQDPVLPDPETAILAVEIAKHDIWDEQHLPEHIRRFARTAHFKGNGQKLTPMNPFYPYLDDLGQDMEQAAGGRNQSEPVTEEALGNAPHENTETFRTVAGRNHWQQARFLFWLESGENGAEFFCVPVRTVWKQWYKPMCRAYEGCGPPEV